MRIAEQEPGDSHDGHQTPLKRRENFRLKPVLRRKGPADLPT
jgi:hypothetical protein